MRPLDVIPGLIFSEFGSGEVRAASLAKTSLSAMVLADMKIPSPLPIPPKGFVDDEEKAPPRVAEVSKAESGWFAAAASALVSPSSSLLSD
jgi:hypothetical protein